jgi:hypothetical protein
VSVQRCVVGGMVRGDNVTSDGERHLRSRGRTIRPMHNLMLVGIAVLLVGAVLKVAGDAAGGALPSQGVAIIAIAGLVGLLAALFVVQRFTDLIPDTTEDMLSPAIAVGITVALAVIGWRRLAR